MNKTIHKILIGIFLLSGISFFSRASAQTILIPGDILFVTVNSNPDVFEFISRVDISSGTTIYFSDNGRNASARRTGEGSIQLTTTQPISAGTIIQIANANLGTVSISPTIGTLTRAGSFNLTTAGDQLLVYQGTGASDNFASFIYGFGFGNSTLWITTGTATANTSYLPSPLVIGTSAISHTANNVQYTCTNKGVYSSGFVADMHNPAYRTGKITSYTASTCGFDAIRPQSTITLASGQQNITANHTVKYQFTFSEAIDTTGFVCNDISLTGTASGKTCISVVQITPNNNTTFEVTAQATSTGSIIATLQTGSITDLAGNPNITGTIVSNIITIDTTLPILTLSGSTTETIAQHSIYTDHGATWTDNIDGSGFVSAATSTVNTAILGTSIIEYAYTNSIGNTGTITRTVNIIDQTAPTITTGYLAINEGNTITINLTTLTNDTNAISGYSFDIDNNGSIDFTNTSGILTLTWDQLQTFGISGNNSTLLPSDVYNIAVSATDNSNNIGSGIFQVKVYNIAPIVGINFPIISGQIYTGNLSLQWTITDPANQDFPMNTDLFFSANGTSYISLATTSSNKTGSFVRDTTTIPDYGSYSIRVRAIDDYGNHTATSVPFKIDNHGPNISGQLVYTIAEGESVRFNLTGTTDTIAGISGFIWTINSTTTGTSTGLLDLTRGQLQSMGITNDGNYTILVQAIDLVGNKSQTTISLAVTNTAPHITITQPYTGIYSGTVIIDRTASDPANADLPLNTTIRYNNGTTSGIIAQGTNLTKPYTRNTLAISDGTGYTISISVADDDTSTTVSGNLFSIDHTAPIINGFTGTYTINEGSGLIIDISSSIDSIAGLSGGASSFDANINNINLPSTSTGYRNLSRANLATYGIVNSSGQAFPITIQIKDAIGNTNIKTGNLNVLNIKPTITITPASTTLSNITNNLPIQRTTSDPIDTPLYIEIAYAKSENGPRTVLSTGISTIFTGFSWDTKTVADGNYYIKATVQDDQDASSTIQGAITINNIPDFVGGGGGSSVTTDYCPNGDFSASFYDNDCGSKTALPTTDQTQIENPIDSTTFTPDQIFNPTITDGVCFTSKTGISLIQSSTRATSTEFQQSLTFLYAYNMTMFNDIEKFKPYDQLTREQAAKIFSNFATNVLCRNTDTTLQPTYNDIKDADPTLIPYITRAYQLGLMKGGKDGKFRPFDPITKSELNAVLVRMLLNQYLNEEGDIRYSNYNTVSTQLGIITKGASPIAITRNDAALMMFRSYKKQSFVTTDDTTGYTIANRNQFVQ